jgi:hypothetical protein
VDGELGGGVAAVSPREHPDEVSLSRLLVQPAAGPEGQRDGVVLVEHLVNRLREERGGVGRVLAHRLGDGDDADAEPLAQELLVAPGLDLAASEARGVEHEPHVEAALGRVGHQALKLGTCLGFAPARVEVAVLAGQLQVVLDGELADRLALRVGGEALTLLLGRLADVGDRTLFWGCLHGATHPVRPPVRSCR